MAHSSDTIDPADLYDGPMPPDNVAPFPPQRFQFIAEADKPAPVRMQPQYVAAITAALDMLGARLLGLLATVAACVLWGFAVYEPEVTRTYAALGFSVTVLLPIVALYLRRG